jgi:hypothetical protein
LFTVDEFVPRVRLLAPETSGKSQPTAVPVLIVDHCLSILSSERIFLTLSKGKTFLIGGLCFSPKFDGTALLLCIGAAQTESALVLITGEISTTDRL